MSDGELRQLFRKHLPSPGFDWLTVEVGAVAGGVPDSNYAAPGGVEGWIEMKKADHWRATIRPGQIGWAERRLRFNPRVFCAVRRDLDELWFYHASKMRELTAMRLNKVDCLGHWPGGPAKWDWNQIAEWLRK